MKYKIYCKFTLRHMLIEHEGISHNFTYFKNVLKF